VQALPFSAPNPPGHGARRASSWILIPGWRVKSLGTGCAYPRQLEQDVAVIAAQEAELLIRVCPGPRSTIRQTIRCPPPWRSPGGAPPGHFLRFKAHLSALIGLITAFCIAVFVTACLLRWPPPPGSMAWLTVFSYRLIILNLIFFTLTQQKGLFQILQDS
jgi:hypothetical protein